MQKWHEHRSETTLMLPREILKTLNVSKVCEKYRANDKNQRVRIKNCVQTGSREVSPNWFKKVLRKN